jgi:hypothetical protein|tara:strand:+ start:494 stop:685 length:192 start_codon:yes stop_codon:yes gene_type:complete
MNALQKLNALPKVKLSTLSDKDREYRRKLGLQAFHHRTDEEKLEAKELNKIFHKLFKLNDPRA